ncbi:MAG: UbiD family decarboxylase domain-containing protein [Promethearchaeota archaeon]
MNFREYIKTLNPIFIDEEVSLKYEIAAILNKLDGTPVYFSAYNLIGNIYSTPDLFAQSVGLSNFSEWIPFFLNARYHFGKMIKATQIPKMKRISVDDIPILTHYEKDAGKYITSDALVATRHEKTNVSTHRILILNKKEATLRIVRRHLYAMFIDAKEHGEDLPIDICIGIPPSVQIAAATSLDPLENELELAASLEGGELPTINGLPESEIIIKGKLLHDKFVEEGPFYDIAEKYDIVREEPVVQIDEILAKENFIYHALLPAGKDHKFLMGLPRIPIIFDEVKKLGVDIKKVHLSPEGFGWLKTIISIKKKSDADIKKVLEGTIKGHYSTKLIIVVDDDVDVMNESEVQKAITLNTKFDKTNPIILTEVKGSSLDPRAEGDLGSKMLIDATKPLQFRKESFEQGKIPFDDTKFTKIKLRRRKLD